MVCESTVSAQQRAALKIVVVEGEGTTNNLQTLSGQPPVVQVRDENDAPVAGANVTFALPERGPGGTFFGVWNKLNVTTNEEGRAAGNGFRPNQTQGSFQIQVTAAQGDRTGTVNITQNNVLPAGGVSRALNPIRKLGRGKIIAALTGAAIIGIVIAARGGDDASTTTTPGTSVTPGTISVGTPR
jgi:hypothetical protein